MKAKELRKIAREVRDRNGKTLTNVLEICKAAAENGEDHINYGEYLSPVITEKLEKLGFDVLPRNRMRLGDGFYISWGDAS